jgi:hypothetical protein
MRTSRTTAQCALAFTCSAYAFSSRRLHMGSSACIQGRNANQLERDDQWPAEADPSGPFLEDGVVREEGHSSSWHRIDDDVGGVRHAVAGVRSLSRDLASRAHFLSQRGLLAVE